MNYLLLFRTAVRYSEIEKCNMLQKTFTGVQGMEIARDIYLNRLIRRKNNGLIKVITGIRRCGKSFLLNTLFYHHLLKSGIDDKHIIRFAFDSFRDFVS